MFPQLTARVLSGPVLDPGEGADRLAEQGLEPARHVWPRSGLRQRAAHVAEAGDPAPPVEVDDSATNEDELPATESLEYAATSMSDTAVARPYLRLAKDEPSDQSTVMLGLAAEVLADLRDDSEAPGRVLARRAPTGTAALADGFHTALRFAAYGDVDHAIASARGLLLDHVNPDILVTALAAWEAAHPDVPVARFPRTRPASEVLTVEQVLALRARHYYGYYGTAVAA